MKAVRALSCPSMAACLLACAAQPPPPVESPEEREAARGALVAELHPEMKIELLPPEEVEKRFGDVLPIGLEELALLRVSASVTGRRRVPFQPHVAFVVEARPRDVALPMYPPSRDLLVAVTGEKLPGPETSSRLAGGSIPLNFAFFLGDLLDFMPFKWSLPSVHVEKSVTVPSEAEKDDAAPRAVRLARALRPRHSCDEPDRDEPCARILVMPRPRDGVAVRLEIDVGIDVPDAPAAVWKIDLPAGKPFEDRIAAAFPDGVVPPAAMRWTRIPDRRRGGCMLRRPDCTSDRGPAPPADTAGPAGAIDTQGGLSRLAKPAESLAARPPWGGDGYAPRIAGAYIEESPFLAGGPLEGALLVCDLGQGTRERELAIEAKVNDGPAYRTFASAFARPSRFFVPLVWMRSGDTLDLAFSNRLGSAGPRTRLALPYRGVLPLAGAEGEVSVSCRALGRAAVEALAERELGVVVDRLQSLSAGAGTLKPHEEDWGRAWWNGRALKESVEGFAALTGWSDPRTQRLLERIERHDETFTRYVRHFIQGRYRMAPALGETITLRDEDLRVVDGACNAALDPPPAAKKAATAGCVILVETRPHAPDPAAPGALRTPELVWPDGKRRGVSWTRAARPSRAHGPAPEGWTRYHVTLLGAYQPQEEGPILLMDGREQVFVRLR